MQQVAADPETRLLLTAAVGADVDAFEKRCAEWQASIKAVVENAVAAAVGPAVAAAVGPAVAAAVGPAVAEAIAPITALLNVNTAAIGDVAAAIAPITGRLDAWDARHRIPNEKAFNAVAFSAGADHVLHRLPQLAPDGMSRCRSHSMCMCM